MINDKIISKTIKEHKYRKDIDGLRAIAVLAVIGFHAFPEWIKGGFIGVDIFFVISGFLISSIIFTELDNNKFNFMTFYSRRIRRIFPSLIIVLLAFYSLGWFTLLADEFQQLGKHILSGAGFISNFTLLREANYFDNTTDTKPLLHLWSLGIEEQFYIIWPFLLWVAWKKRFNKLLVCSSIIILSFLINIITIKIDPKISFYSPVSRFWELISGSMLAYISINKKISPANGNKFLLNTTSTLGIFLIIISISLITKENNFPGWLAIFPIIGTYLLISVDSNTFINRVILSNRTLVWIGLISYPLYLWHWPLLAFSRTISGVITSRHSLPCGQTLL
ncbi:MAG: acyltransferase [Oligoflexia bacterium]|nr:acyltransferase [Oligoflexia bacterium]